MWIAKDDDGSYNAFIVKPRVSKGLFKKSWTWTTMPYAPIWCNIPYVFINLLDDRIKNMSYKDEPLEVNLYISDSKYDIDDAAEKYLEKMKKFNHAAEAFGFTETFGFDEAFKEGAEYILKQIKE